ncbi:MAG: hypothetical protein ACOVSW_16280 [Candidatus Kapaibacteriota bacterium]
MRILARIVLPHPLQFPTFFFMKLLTIITALLLVMAISGTQAQSSSKTSTSKIPSTSSTSSKPDSTKAEKNLMTDEELEAILGDDNDDESYKHWTLRAKISTTTRRTRNGVDVSNDKPAVNPKLGLDYDFTDQVSVSAGAGIYTIIGEGVQGYWWSASASYSPADWLALGLDYTRDIYPADPGNVFGDLTSTISASAIGTWDWFSLSLGYMNLPSATEPAQYYTASIGGYFAFGNFSLSPSVDVSFVNQRVRNERIAQLQERLRRPLPPVFQRRLYTDISGLSSLSFDVGLQYKILPKLKITLTPSLLVTPQISTVSVRETQLVLSGGIQYLLEF